MAEFLAAAEGYVVVVARSTARALAEVRRYAGPPGSAPVRIVGVVCDGRAKKVWAGLVLLKARQLETVPAAARPPDRTGPGGDHGRHEVAVRTASMPCGPQRARYRRPAQGAAGRRHFHDGVTRFPSLPVGNRPRRMEQVLAPDGWSGPYRCGTGRRGGVDLPTAAAPPANRIHRPEHGFREEPRSRAQQEVSGRSGQRRRQRHLPVLDRLRALPAAPPSAASRIPVDAPA